MAIDYEFSINMLTKELQHQKEMHTLLRTHVDAHDAAFSNVLGRFERIEDTLEKTNEMLLRVTTSQLVTEQKLQGLIDLMMQGERGGNGHSKGSN